MQNKERPMLFNAPMVRAVLAETKTQTRRVFTAKNGGLWPNRNDLPGMKQILRNCPYGQPGDRLWVREAWGLAFGSPITPHPDAVIYRADKGNADWDGRWRPSIHMPRWASRILLEIVSVRVERLQDISEDDATAEGARLCYGEPFDPANTISDRRRYELLWEQINGPGSWDANPWVWVIEFKQVQP